MREVGGGQVVGNYTDFELEPGESIEHIVSRFPGEKIEWYTTDGKRIRAIRWITDKLPPPASVIPGEELEELLTHPGIAEERLRDGKSHMVLWSRAGISEIRFDEDGHVYVIKEDPDVEAGRSDGTVAGELGTQPQADDDGFEPDA